MTTPYRATVSHLRRAGRFHVLPLLGFSALLLAASSCARADEYTGLPVDDPKDLLPPPSVTSSSSNGSAATGGTIFAPMPAWARGITLGPMPDKLKPMGKGPVVAAAKPAPAPLAPPKDSPDANGTTAAAAKNSDNNNPTLIAVSPFLQWIKTNPQAAAAAARQQAEVYTAGGAPAAVSANGAPVPSAPPTPGSANDTYWLPPLIDSSTFGNRGSNGSSAAIYSTPQR